VSVCGQISGQIVLDGSRLPVGLFLALILKRNRLSQILSDARAFDSGLVDWRTDTCRVPSSRELPSFRPLLTACSGLLPKRPMKVLLI
jgi:hypothetical protein